MKQDQRTEYNVDAEWGVLVFEYCWDEGPESNTPLQYVLDEVPRPDVPNFDLTRYGDN